MTAALQLEAPEQREVLHVCHIDETQQSDPLSNLGTWREMPLLLWSLTRFATDLHSRRMWPREGEKYTALDKFRVYLMYACEYPSRRKRNPMNVEEMVERWVPIVRGLSVGHDKAEIDRCEFEMERHIMPMLAAPVKQLREFYSALTVTLKNDPAIPMFVWTMFESWGEAILKKAPDGEVVELKKGLALRIADMVEKDVHADLKEALIGALTGSTRSGILRRARSEERGRSSFLRGERSTGRKEPAQ